MVEINYEVTMAWGGGSLMMFFDFPNGFIIINHNFKAPLPLPQCDLLIIWVDVGTNLDQNVDCQSTVKSLFSHPISTNVYFLFMSLLIVMRPPPMFWMLHVQGPTQVCSCNIWPFLVRTLPEIFLNVFKDITLAF